MATKAQATTKAATRTSTAAKTKAPAKVTAKTTTAQGTNAIERKALAMDNKSAGMRLLFDAGYTVARVRTVFNAPYGYVYGVADRHGVVATAAQRRAPRKASGAKVSKRTTTPKAKVTKVAKVNPRMTKTHQANSPVPSATTRVAAKLAARSTTNGTAKVKGRPTAARRAANRKAATTETQVSA